MIAAQCRAGRALINMTVKELAARAKVSTYTVVRFENSTGTPLKPRTVDDLRRALEDAGVAFTNGDEPGVKLKARPD
jgi:transcriptional regulator with XRE-family HTH domain